MLAFMSPHFKELLTNDSVESLCLLQSNQKESCGRGQLFW